MAYAISGIVFIFGLLVGSFLNVISLRFGFSEVRRHRSHCQACGEALSWRELIPLVSFFMLRGKCASCGSRVSFQYPLVELGTGALFLFSYLLAAPFASGVYFFPLMALLFFWSSFIVLLAYDIRHTLVPMAFVAPLAASALALRVGEAFLFSSMEPLYDALWGALVIGGLFLAVVFITRGKGMGLGDVYVAGALGILFGFARGLEVITLAFWIGATAGIALVVLSRVRNLYSRSLLSSPHHARKVGQSKKGFTMKSEVPFVPFLFMATLVGVFTNFSPLAFVGALIASL